MFYIMGGTWLCSAAADGKETIGYDEYMDGGIPDTLLEGLGFYKSTGGTEADEGDGEGENTDVEDEDTENDGDEINESPLPSSELEAQSKNLV
jgi:hypothetical protein